MEYQSALPPLGGKSRRQLDQLTDREVLLGLALMTGVALAIALWTTRAINPLRGDTFEYAYFDPSRTVGYPAFLWLIQSITGRIAWAVPAQMVLLAGSLLLLGRNLHDLVRRPAVSFAFQAVMLSQIAIWKSSAFLMTEGLSAALIALWCAQLLRSIRAPSLRDIALPAAIAGLAAMVRPSLIALSFATAIFAFFTLSRRDRGWSLLITGVGAVLAWGATPVALLIAHGSSTTTSPLARGILQHTLFCNPHSVPVGSDAAFVENSAASVRAYIKTAPSDVQEQLEGAYSTPLRFGLIIPVLGRRHHLEARSQVDPYLWTIARQRVAANPACYVGSIIGSYIRMATFDVNLTTTDSRRIRKFVADHPPVELPQYPVLARDELQTLAVAKAARNAPSGLNSDRQQLKLAGKLSQWALLPVQLLYGAATLAGIVSLFLFLKKRRRSPHEARLFAGVLAMGAALHAVFAITAIVELGLSRYVVPLWPIVCTLNSVAILLWFEMRGAGALTPAHVHELEALPVAAI
jgi:hypothetical protein